jgi:transposase-like protein
METAALAALKTRDFGIQMIEMMFIIGRNTSLPTRFLHTTLKQKRTNTKIATEKLLLKGEDAQLL